ncbi:hypothetical protein [Corynebacterium macginleyi]|uniref:hypothetical protein n=1 Tax=Corynebacterium macginleyi TaxID=38290 RepID=UPI0035C7E2FC
MSHKRLKVDRDWHIICESPCRSVPFQLGGESVPVRLTEELVSIVNGDRRVAGSTRFHGFKYRYSTGPSHRGSILDVSTFRGSGPYAGCSRSYPVNVFPSPATPYHR